MKAGLGGSTMQPTSYRWTPAIWNGAYGIMALGDYGAQTMPVDHDSCLSFRPLMPFRDDPLQLSDPDDPI